MPVTRLSITNSTFILRKTRPKVYGLTGTKRKVTKESSLYIKYGDIHIRHYHTVTYTGYTLDEDLLGGESIALNVIKKKKHYTQTFESGKYYPSLSIVFCLLQ